MSKIINNAFTLPCGQVIKNRICKAAMTERIAKGDNLANQGHVNLYRKWAEGDIGILLTGNVIIAVSYTHLRAHETRHDLV